jgi:organic radical activating enzyme
MDSLTVSEVFGPTIQGEGPSCGRLAAFVRLGLCNLDCSWCDTPYTWDWTGKNGEPQDRTRLYRATPEDLAAEVTAMRVPLVVVTGGEPLVQKAALGRLVDTLHGFHLRVEIETNGSLLCPPEWPVRLNVSPKLRHSGVDPSYAATAMTLYRDDPRAVFKFVVDDVLSFPELDDLIDKYAVAPERVWVMPEGRTDGKMTGKRVTRIAESAITRRYNVSTRLHVLLWGDERGR